MQSAEFDGKKIIHAVSCDVSNEEQVKAMFKIIDIHSGGLDVCVNNAGVIGYVDVIYGSEKEWRRVFDVSYYFATIEVYQIDSSVWWYMY